MICHFTVTEIWFVTSCIINNHHSREDVEKQKEYEKWEEGRVLETD